MRVRDEAKEFMKKEVGDLEIYALLLPCGRKNLTAFFKSCQRLQEGRTRGTTV